VHLRSGEVFPVDLYDKIKADYGRLLRGKSLLAILMRHLSYKGRSVRHNQRALLQNVGASRGPLLNEMFNSVYGVFVSSGITHSDDSCLS
jgi:hypothetical protein